MSATNDDAGATSLSFLDVITNSLGGVLLLFFLMVAVGGTKAVLEQKPSSRGSRPGGLGQVRQPFVVLATAVEGKRLLPDGPGEPWTMRNLPPQYASSSSGPSYAVLYGDGPPPTGASVWLGPLDDGAVFRLQVFRGGRRVSPDRTFTAADFGPPNAAGRVKVWPLPTPGGAP